LEALTQVDDWKIEVPLDHYEIEQIYYGKLIEENGKQYITGAGWNESLDQGQKTEIILIAKELSNDINSISYFFDTSPSTSRLTNESFNLKSTVTDDWGDLKRVVLDLEALTQANDWKIGVPSDHYEIEQIYYGKLLEENGKQYITSAGWNKDLEAGGKAEIVLIVNQLGNDSNIDYFFDSLQPFHSNSTIYSVNKDFNLTSRITDDWGDRQRVILNLEALTKANNWSLELPPNHYEIDQIYNAELTEKNGKQYITGASWNKNLEQSSTIEIILIVKEMNNNTHTTDFFNSLQSSHSNLVEEVFNLQSTITDDWGDTQRIVLDLEALRQANDWSLEVPPNYYEIDQIYNAELIEKNGKQYITGASWNENLEQGSTTEIILIVKEMNNNNHTTDFFDSLQPSHSNSVNENFDLNINSQITEDWNGGYKLEIDLKAESYIQDWQAEFSLPYKIRAVYGVDLVDLGNGNYSINGENDWKDLQQGQSIKSTFIIDDGGQLALEPEFGSSYSEPTPTQETNNLNANSDSGGKTISVDNDFGGNLESAIAAANDGDVVQLGNKTYYTKGININKDITIDGQEGSVINGQGTSESILRLSANASGATIQDVQITNGSIGIYGYKAFNLTLQNLELSNIGINQTVRDGQYNTGIVLNRADGLKLIDSYIHDVGRKGVGINDTDGAVVSNLKVQNVNLAAQHAQSFDAAGVKLFNTNDVIVENSFFSDINAFNIWNDTSNATTIANNRMESVGEDFLKPVFNTNVEIAGIYNEKSPNSTIRNNENTALNGFLGLNATEFSTETMVLENNNFSSLEVNTQDYWVNESIEKLIAITEDPAEADFSLFEDEYFAYANIG
ncbi:MAG: right-handed parallel beta-helix repeat-containing protein, partial [Cyanobacteria bacterium P01_A01_bin.83]